MKCRIDEINTILQEMKEDIPMNNHQEECINYHINRIIVTVNMLVDRLEKVECERFNGGKNEKIYNNL